MVMQMKKSILICLFVLLMLGLSGCGDKEQKKDMAINDGRNSSVDGNPNENPIAVEPSVISGSVTPTMIAPENRRMQLLPTMVPTMSQDNSGEELVKTESSRDATELQGAAKPRIVGLYQGNKVYDIEVFFVRFFESIRPKPGKVYVDVFGQEEIADDSFFRVAIVIQRNNTDLKGGDDRQLNAAFEAIRNAGYPIVEEVNCGKNMPIPSGAEGRYITVLLTKQQLHDWSVPDSELCYFICWEGYLRGAIAGLENGQFISE